MKGKVIKDYIVVDEGWLQRVMSFYEVKITAVEVRAALNKVDMPDKIIITHRNIDECFNRQTIAPHPRSVLGEKYLNNWKKVYMHNFNIFKDYLKESNSVTIVEATVNSNPKMLI